MSQSKSLVSWTRHEHVFGVVSSHRIWIQELCDAIMKTFSKECFLRGVESMLWGNDALLRAERGYVVLIDLLIGICYSKLRLQIKPHVLWQNVDAFTIELWTLCFLCMLTIIHIKAVIVSQVSLKVKVNILGIEKALLWTKHLRIECLLYLDR